VPARGRLELRLVDERAVDITEFKLSGGGLDAAGRGTFARDGRTIARLEVDTIKAGRTDGRGTFTRGPDGIGLVISGPSLDVSPLLRERSQVGEMQEAVRLSARVDRLYLAPDRRFDAIRLEARRSLERWELLDLTGLTPTADGPGKPVFIDLRGEGERQVLRAGADDAGALLRILDVTPNVIGGRIDVVGATDQARPGRPLAGELTIGQFRLVKAPLLARVLSVALLTGILDSLRGEGIGFTGLETKFRIHDTKVELEDLSAYGPALGVTAQAILEREQETIEAEGTIVPAYTVNSVLGNIPLLGPLLVPERGGGIFAANYTVTGPIADPKVSVSPLSTIAPGFLRRLFHVIERGTSPTGSDPRPPGGSELK
jgi:hypothetical protein